MFPLPRFRSFRNKLQTAFVMLGLAAIGITGWQASRGATEALRQATYDRLTAVRQTRARQVERYFEDVRNHVAALSTDESTMAALEQFSNAWRDLPLLEPGDPRDAALRSYYSAAELGPEWIPEDRSTRALQYLYLAANAYPRGAKDLLVSAPGAGAYGVAHTRYHPTFHRYMTAFGFYDIFLIDASQGRVLYSVMKEADLGVALAEAPYASTSLAAAYRGALDLAPDDSAVIEDYTPYFASEFAPAAFVAAPVRRAGAVIGILAIQVSIEEINDLMDGGRRWREEGLGETGHSYIVGADSTLRSDLRLDLENPEAYREQLRETGLAPEMIRQIERHGTAVLTYPVNLEVVERIREGERGTEVGRDFRGRPVIRSHAPLRIGDLNWAIIAEIDTAEAMAPVGALRTQILGTGVLVAGVFFLVAGALSASVTRPVLAVAAAARRLGQGDLGTRVGGTRPDSQSDTQAREQNQEQDQDQDEIAQLAADFNRMSEDLERTTVSKDELQLLAGRLITAQEDERARLARELHDDLTQRLAAIAIDAGRFSQQRAGDPDALRAGLKDVQAKMAGLSEDIHGLSRRLHPAILEDLGLVAAIEAESRAFLERGGPPVDVRTEGEFAGLDRSVQLAVYRVVQEALRNIQRHAEATEVELRLGRIADDALGDAVRLTIRDDGRGFDRSGSEYRSGLGLASMQERSRLLNGRFRVDSEPGRGTVIEVTLPAGGGPAAHS